MTNNKIAQQAADGVAEQALPTRRSFIKTLSGALVAVNIIPLAASVSRAAQALAPNMAGSWEPGNQRPGWMGPPGVANYRIDGLAKVTGQKVYARDYHARNMVGWPDSEQPVMLIRATTVSQLFEGLDLSLLPEQYRPKQVVYAEQLSTAVRLRNAAADSTPPSCPADAYSADEAVDLPPSFRWPFLVARGSGADFFGQPVAMLVFNDRASWLGAKKIIQFNPQFQRYGDAVEPPAACAVDPLTKYVRVAGSAGRDTFSYSQNGGDANYDAECDRYRQAMVQTIDSRVQSGSWKRYAAGFSMRAMDPMFMEPESGLAWYEAAAETLHIVVGTQSPDGDVATLLEMFDGADAVIKPSSINLYSCYPGGGFGGRDSSMFTLYLGIAAAFAGGLPVRLAYDRFEQFQCGLKRHACVGEEQLLVDRSGMIQALLTDMSFDSGGRRNLSPYVAQLAGVCAGGCYNIPQSAIYSQANYSTNISGGSQRGFGGPQAYFIIESLIDEAARDLGLDPFSIRRRNALNTGSRTVVGGPITQSLKLAEILDGASGDPIWLNRDADRAKWQQQGLQYGVGFAMSNQAYGTSGDGVLAAVAIDQYGHFTVRSNAVDMGNGSATTLAVVIADALGANASAVETGNATLWGQLQMSTDSSGSWKNSNWTRKATGSSSACLTGFHQTHVVMQAAKVLFEVGLFPAAQSLWGRAADSLTAAQSQWQNGELTAPGLPSLSLARLAAQIHASGGVSGVLAHAYFQQAWAQGRFAVNGNNYTWPVDGLALNYGGSSDYRPLYRSAVVPPPAEAARFVRTEFSPCGNLLGVTVNPKTGEVVLRASASFLNAGRVMTESLVSGQSQGGIAMATGWALLEDMPPGAAGPASGDWNLNRYYVAKSKDVPLDQRLITLPPDSEVTGRGIAEAVMCSVAPAISNAIYDAVGVRFRELPITPSKVREVLNG